MGGWSARGCGGMGRQTLPKVNRTRLRRRIRQRDPSFDWEEFEIVDSAEVENWMISQIVESK
jgi:hypothetical protein